MLTPFDKSDRLNREIALAELYHAARQYAVAAAEIPSGNATQELLHAREGALQAAALAYATALGWTAPAAPPAN